MIIYEVNLTIDKEIFSEYKQWLLKHVDVMLKFKGFKHAEIWQSEREKNINNAKNLPQEDADKVLLTVWYHIDTRDSLDNYLQNSAQDMRADAVSRFGNKFSATRRIFNKLS